MKGNDVFKMAIAVAPVTSWRFYDTIYTEIYNGDPNENPFRAVDNGVRSVVICSAEAPTEPGYGGTRLCR